MTPIAATVAALRDTFAHGITRPYRWRATQLRALRRMLTENEPAIEQALRTDLGKHPTETLLTETGFTLAEIDHTLRHLTKWMRPRRARLPIILAPAQGRILYEPLGVVLIIGPWNYPLQLVLSPLVGALAAGNAAIVKPSEIASATSALLADLMPRYLDRRAVAVVEGNADTTTDLLDHEFDHIFFTGSTKVGTIVACAAARTLTPVTLELGGKSPVYVDDTVDLAVTARRIMWGKLMNAGQTCVAPDYLLATPRTADALIPHLTAAIRELYGDTPAHNPDYGTIITTGHAERLRGLLDGQPVTVGGTVTPDIRYAEPTIVNGAHPHSPLMQEEIFGPILPIVHVDSAADAVRFIAARPKPLALYVFTRNRRVRRLFLTRTSSGALSFGATTAHLSAPGLPFGGVGASGMGAYHGEYSFTTFSHAKPVLTKPLAPDTLALAYPPYGRRATGMLTRFMRRG